MASQPTPSKGLESSLSSQFSSLPSLPLDFDMHDKVLESAVAIGKDGAMDVDLNPPQIYVKDSQSTGSEVPDSQENQKSSQDESSQEANPFANAAITQSVFLNPTGM